MSCAGWTQTVMHISTLPGSDPVTSAVENIMREAYRRLGISLEVTRMPGERSLISANHGVTDGDLYRKAGLEASYPQLQRVPVPLVNYEIVAFSKNKHFTVDGWESLRGYSIGFVRGIKIVEENTQGMRTEPVATMEQAFSKLALNRTDLVLANRASGLATLRALDLQDIKVLTPAITRFPLLHYLNIKHASLLPRLTAVLTDMERDKTIGKLQGDLASMAKE